jgi:hypothetical protein
VPLRIRLSPTKNMLPRELRSWIRGSRPALDALAYPKQADAITGYQFYAVESQPKGELEDDAKRFGELRQKLASLTDLIAVKDEDNA